MFKCFFFWYDGFHCLILYFVWKLTVVSYTWFIWERNVKIHIKHVVLNHTFFIYRGIKMSMSVKKMGWCSHWRSPQWSCDGPIILCYMYFNCKPKRRPSSSAIWHHKHNTSRISMHDFHLIATFSWICWESSLRQG